MLFFRHFMILTTDTFDFSFKRNTCLFLLGYTSYRDTERGSWFIQEFVDVFYEHADEEHVMDMLTEVRTYQSSQYLDCKIGDCFQKRFVFAIYRYRCKKKNLNILVIAVINCPGTILSFFQKCLLKPVLVGLFFLNRIFFTNR